MQLKDLRKIISKMKAEDSNRFFKVTEHHGNSELFNYATNKRFERKELKQMRLDTWNKLLEYEISNSKLTLPNNGFEELITLTEQGRLWKFPIDNEQGLEAEKQVPFEDHVFLDQYLEDFPKSEYIQSFMGYVIAGLGRNYWMTTDRKREIINFYKGYFEHNRDKYKERGLDI